MFASLAWPDRRVSAGCDVNANSIAAARSLGIYSRLDGCDASKRLPYEDDAFDLVFNNSALEHIKDVDAALFEVSRVLADGGVFFFNVLNHRYFEWWPLDEESKNGYKRWQPFYHALNLEEWTERLARVGLQVTSVQGYFDQEAAQELARLDFTFSGAYLANRPKSWSFVLPILSAPHEKILAATPVRADLENTRGCRSRIFHQSSTFQFPMPPEESACNLAAPTG